MKKLSILAVLFCSTLGHAAYRFRYQVTVDHTQSGSSDSASFPILVYISSSTDFKTAANGGYIQNTTTLNGQTVPADLIVTADAACQTPVPAWEVASYSASSGTVELWVNQGTLSHTVDTVFYVCIDNPSVNTYQSTAASTWSSSFLAALHLANGTALSVSDSTVNAQNGTNHGATAATGQVDGAAAFVGASSEYVTLGTISALTGASKASLCGWMYRASGSNKVAFGAYLSHSRFNIVVSSAGVNNEAENGSLNYPAYLGTITGWHWFCMTFDGTQGVAANRLVAYFDGAPQSLTPGGAGNPTTLANSDFRLGIDSANGYSTGDIDEVWVTSTVLTPDLLSAAYNEMKSSQTMVTLGPRSAMGGPRGSQVVKLDRGVRTRGLH